MLSQETITSSTEPTGRVRWRRVDHRQGTVPGLILEQQFIVTDYRDGEPYRKNTEWHEVEIVQ